MDAAGQLAALRDFFALVLEVRPASVAVLGIAGGNGLDCIDSNVTQRVVGIDMMTSYLETVRLRHAELPGLELHCADLAREDLQVEPVSLVHAALVFEHAGVERCLDNAISLVGPGGFLSVVLQLPAIGEMAVTPSRFTSIQALKDDFVLVDREWLAGTLAEQGFLLTRICHRSVPGGKAFWMGIFAGPHGKME